jgi:hypothetical protein
LKKRRRAPKSSIGKNSKRVSNSQKLAGLKNVNKRKSQFTDSKINMQTETASWKTKYYLRLVSTFLTLQKFKRMLRSSKSAGMIAKK